MELAALFCSLCASRVLCLHVFVGVCESMLGAPFESFCTGPCRVVGNVSRRSLCWFHSCAPFRSAPAQLSAPATYGAQRYRRRAEGPEVGPGRGLRPCGRRRGWLLQDLQREVGGGGRGCRGGGGLAVVVAMRCGGSCVLCSFVWSVESFSRLLFMLCGPVVL